MPPRPVTLEPRSGPRPKTVGPAPHSQVDQLPPPHLREKLSAVLLDAIAGLPDVTTGPSRRAPPGSVGFYMEPASACGDARCFLLGTEFAHVHVMDDGSLHAILPEPLRTAAIEAGWAEPHPLAGQPTISPDTVMIYAPRDDGEAATITALVRRSWENARA